MLKGFTVLSSVTTYRTRWQLVLCPCCFSHCLSVTVALCSRLLATAAHLTPLPELVRALVTLMREKHREFESPSNGCDIFVRQVLPNADLAAFGYHLAHELRLPVEIATDFKHEMWPLVPSGEVEEMVKLAVSVSTKLDRYSGETSLAWHS